MNHSPDIEIDPARVPAHPKVLNTDAISPAGYVTSIQATRFAGFFRAGEPAATGAQLTRYAELLNLYYPTQVPILAAKLGAKGIRCEVEADGTSRFKVDGLVVIEMGPPRAVPGEPGVTQRVVRRGLLIPSEDQYRGLFETSVRQRGNDLICAIAIRDYRSTVRGTRENDALRAHLYKATQLAAHAVVGVGFLRGMEA